MRKRLKLVKRLCPICSCRDESNVFAEENMDMQLLDNFAFSSRKIPEYMHYRLVVCPKCDVLYANPLPPLTMIAKAYHEAAFDSSAEARYAARTYGHFLGRILKKTFSRQGALDIGTGDGAFLEVLLKKGFDQIIGVEPSKAPIASSKKEIRPLIKNMMFNPVCFKKQSMSLVTCFQTLEHLYDPLRMCRGAYSILKKGGAFFVVSHNRYSLSTKLLGTKSPIFDIEHLQLFSPRSARFMFEKAGFSDIEVKNIFNIYPLHYWLKLFPFPNRLKKWLIEILKNIGIGHIPIPLPAGNMVVIGYKKPK